MSRKLLVLTPLEINKINLLWFANQRNITSIGKSLRRSPQVCERFIFKSRQEWYDWSDAMIKEGKL